MRTLESENAALAEAALETHKLLTSQQAAIARLEKALASERDRNNALTASTSWQLTAPVRRVKTMIDSARGVKPPQPVMQDHAAAADATPAQDMIGQDRYRRWIAEARMRAPIVASVEPMPDVAVSVLVALVADTPSARLRATLDSLRAQGQDGWEVIVARYAGRDQRGAHFDADPPAADSRLKTLPHTMTCRGAALRAAADLATGTFVLPLEAGDLLAPHSLAAFARHLRENPDLDILYADEDRMRDGERTEPHFKPDWSPELLTAYDYFGRPTLVRRHALEAVGSFADDGGVACEWDLHLRIAGPDMQRARTSRIGRVTDVLCHLVDGPAHGRRTPDDPAATDFRKVLARHWRRQGIVAHVKTHDDGTLHADWVLDEPPLVSVVIPSRDRADLLRNCLDGLLARTSYPHVEIIVVDNGSTDADTLNLYGDAAMAGVRIVPFDDVFNYSRACNMGAAAARGDMLLFINNDIEMMMPGWLDQLVRVAARPGVGAVGPKLVYPNDDPQHCGVVIGLQDLCAHAFRRAPATTGWGVFGSPDVTRNYLAVTGACLLLKREVFDRVGGFDESFELAYSDVKLAIDAWRAGYRNVYVAESVLVHLEGATRGTRTPTHDQRAVTMAIGAAGLTEDPYFHPAFRADRSIPTLRIGDEPALGAALQTRLAKLDVARRRRVVDPCDDRAMAMAAGLPLNRVLWLPAPAQAVRDADSAAKFIIDLLRTRTDIRARFPLALSEGRQGAFAAWLKADGRAGLSLPVEAAAFIDAAFAADHASRGRQVALFDDGLRNTEPMFLLPPGRAALARCVFAAAGRGAIGLVDAWWLLLTVAEAPERELVLTWQLTPSWQRTFPAATTVFGCDALSAWLRRDFNISEDWVDPARWPITLSPAQQIRMAYLSTDAWRDRFPRCFEDPERFYGFLHFLASDEARLTLRARAWLANLDMSALIDWLDVEGLNVVGHFRYPSGLRTSVEAMVAALRSAGVATALRDVRVDIQTDEPGHERFVEPALFETTLIHVQPIPLFDRSMARAGLADVRADNYRIGYWYWELETIPADWDHAASACQELWTASDFVAQGLRARYAVPVEVLPPGLQLPEFPRLPRSHFGFAEDAFIFNFTFHMPSVMERKNPLGLIAAFRKAFTASENVFLVIKTAFAAARNPAGLAALQAAAEGLNVHIMDAILSRAETLALMAACDAYCSLHRSEGLGLTMAEAMLLEKPTIGTGYSGNLEFMDEGNSLLVDYRLVALDRDHPPYAAGSVWADPDVDQAAALMRRLFTDRMYGRELGKLARADVLRKYNIDRCGRAMADRLKVVNRRHREYRTAPLPSA